MLNRLTEKTRSPKLQLIQEEEVAADRPGLILDHEEVAVEGDPRPGEAEVDPLEEVEADPLEEVGLGALAAWGELVLNLCLNLKEEPPPEEEDQGGRETKMTVVTKAVVSTPPSPKPHLLETLVRSTVTVAHQDWSSPSGRRDPTRAENFSSVRDKSANSLNGLMKFLLQVNPAMTTLSTATVDNHQSGERR